MRCFLSTAEALLHGFAPRLANKRLALIVMLSIFVPAESFAEMRIVDSRYVELTGDDYFMWKQGALSADALCAPVGYLTMKAPPYTEVQHCFCGDPNRFSEQPNAPENSEQLPESVLFLAYGDQDGDPVVCPWEIDSTGDPPDGTGPDGSTASESGVESEAGPGSGPAAGEPPPPPVPQETGGCQAAPEHNTCNTTTEEECARRNRDNASGAPWRWCGAFPDPDACKSENGRNVCK